MITERQIGQIKKLLGRSEQELYQKMTENDIKGYAACALDCPLSNLIKKITNLDTCVTGVDCIVVNSGDFGEHSTEFALQIGASDFRRNFDLGKYPELVAK